MPTVLCGRALHELYDALDRGLVSW
jgi:hypothetical protein